MGCGWRSAGLIPVPVLVLSAPLVLLAGLVPPGPSLLLAGLARSLFGLR